MLKRKRHHHTWCRKRQNFPPATMETTTPYAAPQIGCSHALPLLLVKDVLEPIQTHLRQIGFRPQLTMLAGPERVVKLIQRSQISQSLCHNRSLPRDTGIVLAIANEYWARDLIEESVKRVGSQLGEPVERRCGFEGPEALIDDPAEVRRIGGVESDSVHLCAHRVLAAARWPCRKLRFASPTVSRGGGRRCCRGGRSRRRGNTSLCGNTLRVRIRGSASRRWYRQWLLFDWPCHRRSCRSFQNFRTRPWWRLSRLPLRWLRDILPG